MNENELSIEFTVRTHTGTEQQRVLVDRIREIVNLNDAGRYRVSLTDGGGFEVLLTPGQSLPVHAGSG